MAIINVLDRRVAELIAAGEVVERPSSVVKELVENSIDAGASSVTVEIKNGGITYIRITDNGCGIERSELPKAFLRHATSKVKDEDDLASISTLGFRGEALASVAAMCRVEVLTRCTHEEIGSRYIIEGGTEVCNEGAGCPVGTTIVVRDIFYNTPARMKFLKKDITEAGSVAGVLERVALSHPEVSVKFIKDGQIKLHTPGDGKLYSAIYSVLGKEFASGLTEVSYSYGSLEISGYISKPECSKANRAMQFFFVNNRIVRSSSCTAALEEAYRNSIMTGKFPGCVLKLNLPYNAVDVNVHPAKIEVRFSDEKSVFDLVYYGAKNALQALKPIAYAADTGLKAPKVNELTIKSVPLTGSQQVFSAQQYKEISQEPKPHEYSFSKPVKITSFTEKVTKPLQTIMQESTMNYDVSRKVLNAPAHLVKQEKVDNTINEAAAAEDNAIVVSEKSQAVPYTVIGQLFDTYILLEQGNELVLLDKHAAHERLIFDELRNNTDTSIRQTLLSPVAVAIPNEYYSSAVERLGEFEELGFLADDFGDGTLLVREAPMLLDKQDICFIVEDIAHRIHSSQNDLTPQSLDELYHSVACKAAIKGGRYSSMEELKKLVAKLESTGGIRHCPHGRPVAVAITKNDIEKMFGRRT